ncbi:hypothetical protein [uncultured Ottowia sp.]|nr:hypothetical protein [uncultured Ottowia sp.]
MPERSAGETSRADNNAAPSKPQGLLPADQYAFLPLAGPVEI